MSCVLADLLQSPKTPESQKYEEIMKKKKKQNRPPRVWPRKHEKNLRKWPKIGGFGICFSIFVRIFGVQPGVGDIVFFRNFYTYFWDSGVFLGSVAGPQARKA